MNENQTPLNTAGGNEITLWSILRLLVSKLFLLRLAGVAVGLAVFLVLNFLVTPKYESRVSFSVYNSADGASHVGTINNNDLQAAESLAATYSKILESNSVLDSVLGDLGSVGISRKDLGRMTEVAVVPDTQLLEVVVTSTDPELACRIADSFAKVATTEIVRITKAGGVEVVDRPEVATEKSSPRTVFGTVIGVVIGVIIMSVIVILRAMSDTTIYLSEDIDKLGGITVLGQIPEIGAQDEKYVYWKVVKGGVVRLAEKKGQPGNGN